MTKQVMIFLLVILVALAGCDQLDTGDSKDDAEAVQSFFPTIAGYTVQGSEGVQDAIITALGGSAVLTGNPVQLALVQRVDSMLDCYRDKGAVEAKIYIENVANMTEARIPIAGALIVINQNRVVENFASCALSSGITAQSVTPEPCAASGSFTYEGDSILYFYAATDTPLCDMFQLNFNAYGG